MSYRILVVAHTETHMGYFVIRGGDMGDVLSAKDHLIAQLNHREPGLTPDAQSALEFVGANLPVIPEATIHLTTFETAAERKHWTDVYADREYVLDMATGEVTSPQWSMDMDSP